jgi:hypothetical protein
VVDTVKIVVDNVMVTEVVTEVNFVEVTNNKMASKKTKN